MYGFSSGEKEREKKSKRSVDVAHVDDVYFFILLPEIPAIGQKSAVLDSYVMIKR